MRQVLTNEETEARSSFLLLRLPLCGTVAVGNARGGGQGLGGKSPAGRREGAQEGAGGLASQGQESIPPWGARSAVRPLSKKQAVEVSRPLWLLERREPLSASGTASRAFLLAEP